MKKIVFCLVLSLMITGLSACSNLFNDKAVSKYQISKESKPKLTNPKKDSAETLILNSEPLAKSLLNKDEMFLLGNDMYYIDRESYFYGQYFHTLFIISGKGEIINRFTDVDLVGAGGIIDKDSKFFMSAYTSRGYLYGLYDFNAMDWEVEPTFKRVEQISKGYFSAISEGGRLGVIDQLGNTVIPFDFGENEGYFRHVGDYFIFCDYEKMVLLVYDKAGNQISEINGYSGESFGKHIMVYDTSAQLKLYDVNGNLTFDASTNPQIAYTFDPYVNKIIELEGNEYRIYDDAYQLLCKGNINADEYVYPQEKYYTISNNSNGEYSEKFYDYKGNLLVTQEGKAYNRTNYRYLYYQNHERNEVDLLDTTKMKRIILKGTIKDNQSLIELGEHCLGISDYENGVNRMKIYNKNGDLILDDEIEWAYAVGDYILCTSRLDYTFMNARGYYTLLDQEGEIMYQSQSHEYIMPLNDSLLFVQRGCFLGIMDMEGNWQFKTIISEME